jgi:hypothetical protein
VTKSPIPNSVVGHWSLVIFLSCIIAVLPLLRADSPCTHDGGAHYFRVVATRQALQDGLLFTRFLPDLAFGYGYPFYNYRAALSYYLALVFHLVGLSLPMALNLVYALSIVGSALAAYLLARDLFGPQAGIVAAVAYAYTPYQFLDALLRGNLPESVVLALVPLILWAFRRLALSGQRRWFLIGAFSLAALYLTHNISSLIFTPILVAFLFVLWLVYRREGHWVVVGGALVLALGLAAFFWGPALLEKGYVQLHMSRSTRNNDFHFNFISLAEMFPLFAPVDTSLMNPPMRFHLGLVQAALAGAGLLVGIIQTSKQESKEAKERRANLIFFGVFAAACVFMSTRASLWLWDHVPLLPFIQFPWRFVGRATLPVALLVGASIPTPQYASRIAHHASRLLPLILVSVLILIALPYTYPPDGYCPSAPYPTINDLFAYEHRSKRAGLAATGAFFPRWVQRRPVGSPLEEQYAAGSVARFDGTALPAGASVAEADYGANQARIVVETPAPFRARYLAFYFPGWRVQVDGESAEITPSDPEGLITFEVPAGRHILTVRFGETPLRLAADAISVFSLVLLLGIAFRYPDIRCPTSDVPHPASQAKLPFVGYCLLFVILLGFKLAIVDQTKTPFRRPALRPDGTLPGVEHILNQPYADGLTLIGFDQDYATLPADGTLRLDLYWTAHAGPAASYKTVVHLVGPDGLRWSMHDSFRPRGYDDYPPTTTWEPGRYALDNHEIEPLPGTPPGIYDVVLTVFDRDTLSPLSVLNEQGQPAAPTLSLGRVTLTHPRHTAELPENDHLNISLGSFDLVTADFDRSQAAPGDTVHLTLLWHAKYDGEAASKAYYQSLALLAPDNTMVADYPLPPPILSWKKGDVWRSQHQLILPAVLETGTYTWTAKWRAFSSDPIGQLSVVAPPHTFTSPSVAPEINAHLGDVATLLGVNLEPSNLESGTPLTVTLIWRAESTPSTSYHVFLHLIGPDGQLVAQSDGIPAEWTRPTTGWLPGEYITDVHTLPLPEAPIGEYTLLAGLYVPGGERLATPDGSDTILLTTFMIGE